MNGWPLDLRWYSLEADHSGPFACKHSVWDKRSDANRSGRWRDKVRRTLSIWTCSSSSISESVSFRRRYHWSIVTDVAVRPCLSTSEQTDMAYRLYFVTETRCMVTMTNSLADVICSDSVVMHIRVQWRPLHWRPRISCLSQNHG